MKSIAVIQNERVFFISVSKLQPQIEMKKSSGSSLLSEAVSR